MDAEALTKGARPGPAGEMPRFGPAGEAPRSGITAPIELWAALIE